MRIDQQLGQTVAASQGGCASGFSIAADFRNLVEPSHSGLAWLVRMTGDGPVILPCGKERLQGEPLCTLVDEIPNPVLLVR